jgi:hypothetical protein
MIRLRKIRLPHRPAADSGEHEPVLTVRGERLKVVSDGLGQEPGNGDRAFALLGLGRLVEQFVSPDLWSRTVDPDRAALHVDAIPP